MKASTRHVESPHVVIVGGGFGGLSAARALRNACVSITLIDRQNHHLFQPLLYQVATAGLSSNEIAYPIRSVLRRQTNIEVVMAEVISIDVQSHKVMLRDRDVDYDYLILATGVRHSYFGHPEWEERAPGLKDLADALQIRRRVLCAFERAEFEENPEKRNSLLTFVIVGGGPTGVELAGAMGELACNVLRRDFRRIDPRTARIVLVEAGPRVLPGFPEELSARAEDALRKLCVEVRINCVVSSIDSETVGIGSEAVRSATIIWAAGVQASPLGRSIDAHIDKIGRVLVEPDLSVPGHSEVFVIGDLAAFVHQTGEPLPGLAPVAVQQGRCAAQNIRRRCRGLPSRRFRYVDRGVLATIGRGAAVADFGRLKLSGLCAWIAWALVHIFQLIGFRNRFVVMFEWAWGYLTYKRSARLIIGVCDEGMVDSNDR